MENGPYSQLSSLLLSVGHCERCFETRGYVVTAALPCATEPWSPPLSQQADDEAIGNVRGSFWRDQSMLGSLDPLLIWGTLAFFLENHGIHIFPQ